ncbi:hypothetical protein LCGC14_2433550, partial [marine sediment metagenome]
MDVNYLRRKMSIKKWIVNFFTWMFCTAFGAA